MGIKDLFLPLCNNGVYVLYKFHGTDKHAGPAIYFVFSRNVEKNDLLMGMWRSDSVVDGAVAPLLMYFKLP